MINTSISRRKILELLKGAAALGVCSYVAPTIFSGCQKGQSIESKTAFSDQKYASLPCPTDNTLSEEQKARRLNLKYVDQTVISTRTCDNCKLYTQPKTSHCGECTIVPGPIHPKGWCSSWYYRM